VTFPAVPKVDQAAVQAEADLNQKIKLKVVDLFQKNITSINEVVTAMSDMEGLPPGGGICSKRNFIWNYMLELKPELAQQQEEESQYGATSSLPIEIISQRLRAAAGAGAGLDFLGGGGGGGPSS
jgi:hypothetical protein